MLEVYSDNLDVVSGFAIPLNNVTLQKGSTAILSSNATIQLNRRGIYDVEVDGFAEAGVAGLITVQLMKNGVLQPQAISSVTGATGEVDVFNFHTQVQVLTDNTCCCGTAPTLLQIINTGVDITGAHINVCVSKLC